MRNTISQTTQELQELYNIILAHKETISSDLNNKGKGKLSEENRPLNAALHDLPEEAQTALKRFIEESTNFKSDMGKLFSICVNFPEIPLCFHIKDETLQSTSKQINKSKHPQTEDVTFSEKTDVHSLEAKKQLVKDLKEKFDEFESFAAKELEKLMQDCKGTFTDPKSKFFINNQQEITGEFTDVMPFLREKLNNNGYNVTTDEEIHDFAVIFHSYDKGQVEGKSKYYDPLGHSIFRVSEHLEKGSQQTHDNVEGNSNQNEDSINKYNKILRVKKIIDVLSAINFHIGELKENLSNEEPVFGYNTRCLLVSGEFYINLEEFLKNVKKEQTIFGKEVNPLLDKMHQFLQESYRTIAPFSKPIATEKAIDTLISTIENEIKKINKDYPPTRSDRKVYAVKQDLSQIKSIPDTLSIADVPKLEKLKEQLLEKKKRIKSTSAEKKQADHEVKTFFEGPLKKVLSRLSVPQLTELKEIFENRVENKINQRDFLAKLNNFIQHHEPKWFNIISYFLYQSRTTELRKFCKIETECYLQHKADRIKDRIWDSKNNNRIEDNYLNYLDKTKISLKEKNYVYQKISLNSQVIYPAHEHALQQAAIKNENFVKTSLQSQAVAKKVLATVDEFKNKWKPNAESGANEVSRKIAESRFSIWQSRRAMEQYAPEETMILQEATGIAKHAAKLRGLKRT